MVCPRSRRARNLLSSGNGPLLHTSTLGNESGSLLAIGPDHFFVPHTGRTHPEGLGLDLLVDDHWLVRLRVCSTTKKSVEGTLGVAGQGACHLLNSSKPASPAGTTLVGANLNPRRHRPSLWIRGDCSEEPLVQIPQEEVLL